MSRNPRPPRLKRLVRGRAPNPGRALLAILVSLQLVGCTTTRVMTYGDLRREMVTGADHVIVTGQSGTRMRVDSHSELRFLLRSGEVTRWVRGRDLWRSDLGISFQDQGGIFLATWHELVGIEVRNLSGGKTAAAVVLGTVIVGLVVLAVIASAKGGSGLGGNSGKLGGRGKSKRRSGFANRPVARRRLLRPGRGGVHLHVPLALALSTHGPHHPGPTDAPPPPPPPAAPPPAPPAEPGPPPGSGPAQDEAVDIHATSPAHAEAQRPPETAATAATAPGTAAQPLFDAAVRRRSWIQLFGTVAAGTELARFEGYTGSVAAGIRVRDVIEIGGGFRNTLARPRGADSDELDPGYVGFGRLGLHLWLDDGHRVALPVSVDAGAGAPVRAHLRLNLGLRVFPTRWLSIGLYPFNPSFHYYTEDSSFRSAQRWRFPSTLELGFCL